jgi:hypothetical protein
MLSAIVAVSGLLLITIACHVGFASTNWSSVQAIRVLDNFDEIDIASGNWWENDGTKVYRRQFTTERCVPGGPSMRVEFEKDEDHRMEPTPTSTFAIQSHSSSVRNGVSRSMIDNNRQRELVRQSLSANGY